MPEFSSRLMFINRVYFRFISQRIRNFDLRLPLVTPGTFVEFATGVLFQNSIIFRVVRTRAQFSNIFFDKRLFISREYGTKAFLIIKNKNTFLEGYYGSYWPGAGPSFYLNVSLEAFPILNRFIIYTVLGFEGFIMSIFYW